MSYKNMWNLSTWPMRLHMLDGEKRTRDSVNLTSDDSGLHAPQEIAASMVVSDTPAPTATPIAITSPMGVPDISLQEAAPSSVNTSTRIAEKIEVQQVEALMHPKGKSKIMDLWFMRVKRLLV